MHHGFQLVQQVVDLTAWRAARLLTYQPRRAVLLGEGHPEFETATHERVSPEAHGQVGKPVGVVVTCLLACQQEFAWLQLLTLQRLLAAAKAQLRRVVKKEPLLRLADDLQGRCRPIEGPPDQLQRLVAKQHRVGDLIDQRVHVVGGQHIVGQTSHAGAGLAALHTPFQRLHRSLAAANGATYRGTAAHVAVHGNVFALALQDRVRVGQDETKRHVHAAIAGRDLLGQAWCGACFAKRDEIGGGNVNASGHGGQ